MLKIDLMGYSFNGEILIEERIVDELIRLYDWNSKKVLSDVEEKVLSDIESEIAEMIEYDEFEESITFAMEQTIDGDTYYDSKQYPVTFDKQKGYTIATIKK